MRLHPLCRAVGRGGVTDLICWNACEISCGFSTSPSGAILLPFAKTVYDSLIRESESKAPQLARQVRQALVAVRPNDDHVLDHHATPTDLVIGCLDTQHHAVFEHDALACRAQRRKFVHVDADAMPAMAALVIGQRTLAHPVDRDLEEIAGAHACARSASSPASRASYRSCCSRVASPTTALRAMSAQ